MTGAERIMRRLISSRIPLNRRSLTDAALRLAVEEAPLSPASSAAEAVSGLVGLGPVEALLSRPGVTDILINGPDDVWVEVDGELRPTTVQFADDAAVGAAVQRVIAPLGLRFDIGSPSVAARLGDGSRLQAVMPPASVDRTVVAIRRFVPLVGVVDDLLEVGTLDHDSAALIRLAVRERHNLLVTGATGAGKTTLLNVIGAEIPHGQRVVTIEDAAELRLPGHVVRLEGRPPNAEGAGEVTLESLVRSALRLRPDRIVVGEVRGPEALDLVQAMSTGHDGSMGTIHANGPEEALWRLETLALRGPDARSVLAVRRQIWAAINTIVHISRVAGNRRVTAIHRVRADATEEIYSC